MPVFENRVDLVVRGIKVFFNVQAGAARDGALEPASRPGISEASQASGKSAAGVRRLEHAGRRIVRKGRALRAKARRRRGVGEDGGIRPENVVWIFGSARTGSTWLARMMEELEGYTVWREPLVGALFGNLYYGRAEHLIGKEGKHYILGDGYRESWLDSIHTFVLKEATNRFPEVAGPNDYLVIKEPNGSVGAPLLMEALPESRMILLVRDPRDVVASSMDGRRKGGWQYENRNKGERKSKTLADEDPGAFARNVAKRYLKGMGLAKQAYEAHEGRKVLVRYEELRADTLGTMRRIYSELGMPVDEGELKRAVKEHSWESIPEELKGKGKTFRKAKPGGWREDLTPEQVETVEKITAPLLEEFYPDRVS